MYRILKDHGFIYRARIYDIESLTCTNENQTVSSLDDIEERFDEAVDSEIVFFEGTAP